MALVTIYKLAEEILNILNGGQIQTATGVTFNDVKLSIGEVANSLLKVEHFTVNERLGEKIPNGSVLGLYEGIAVSAYKTGRSQATLPVKPIKLPRNMGVFSVYLTNHPEQEFIPLQMGQYNMIRSQPLISDILGQIGYECFGTQLVFTKDLIQLFPDETLSMRLAILDISQYDDYDVLPILPEQVWQIKQEVIKIYAQEPVADYVVDSTSKSLQGTPINQQQQP